MNKTIEQSMEDMEQFPLFYGIEHHNLPAMLGCLGYKIEQYKKGEYISMEGEHLENIGIVLEGTVDMIKEDFWGNKTILMRMPKQTVFGETFICGTDAVATVSFYVSENAEILFLPFKRVMHTCTNACAFHHRLQLMKKVEVVTKKTLREKILAYLSQQAQLQGAEYFEIPLGRVELAEYLCADRSALTRELTAMKNEGVLDYDRNMFRLF